MLAKKYHKNYSRNILQKYEGIHINENQFMRKQMKKEFGLLITAVK
jgi:hypothetical protein